jgi:Flp pilus assembly protein TadD
MEGRYEAAVVHFQSAAQLDPLSGRVQLELGRALLIGGDDEAAQQALLEMRRLRPDSSLGILELAESHRRKGDLDQALRCMLDLHRRHPTRDRPLLLIHALMLVTGRIQEGVQLFSAVTRIHRPDWSFAREALGDFLLRTGQTKLARSYYQAAVELGGISTSLERKLSLVKRKLALQDAPSPASHPGLRVPATSPAPGNAEAAVHD